MKPMLTVWVSRVGGGGGLLTRALGTGTGMEGTRGMGTRGIGTGMWGIRWRGALARLPVLELVALSDELLRPDWLLASLRCSR